MNLYYIMEFFCELFNVLFQPVGDCTDKTLVF